MFHLVILPAAREDLIEIGDFIALDNPARASGFMEEIEMKMISIAKRPDSFSAREDLHKGLRSAQYGRYLIFFTKTKAEVRIVRIIHGARDLPGLFEQ